MLGLIIKEAPGYHQIQPSYQKPLAETLNLFYYHKLIFRTERDLRNYRIQESPTVILQIYCLDHTMLFRNWI